MKETGTLVVGASISGLALGACLQKQGVDFAIIEKHDMIATPWRHHYHRLHLHTNKRVSNLPFKSFNSDIPKYPSRMQVIKYLEDYRSAFDIKPFFSTEAKSIRKEDGFWITETNNEIFRSKYLAMATGPFSKPKPIDIKGMESFPGKIIHSQDYKTGKDFKAQNVLVIGFGNSACEIAIDLYEQGAFPSMSVRSPVNVIPRDILGIPILEVSLLLHHLPARLADFISAPLLRLVFGDITKLGLKKKSYGPFEEIKRDGHIPVLDIGTIKHIRDSHIDIYGGINRIENNTVYFKDGQHENFDAIIAGIGYYRDYAEILAVDKTRFEDLNFPILKQKYFGKDGLYFCGFFVGPTGQIREIASDAQKIALDIKAKSSSIIDD